ncbi:hypothetical protein Leryth_025126 [Lithospermum erythrorhizon]|nr:hypothetical protein Leryth_025126 [Lithospermum erythrorhizon]
MQEHNQNLNTTKPFDITILGASGFTGKYVIREALKFINTPNSPLKSLALAGRNPSKLAQSLKWATLSNPPQPELDPIPETTFLNTTDPNKPDPTRPENPLITPEPGTMGRVNRPDPTRIHPDVSILNADTSDPESLRRLASQSKVILNCVGPFRLYGEGVVSACVEMGCDYLDICGEPEFMERMEALYHEKAGEKGSLVISACGFDSVPAELGLMFNSRQWGSNSGLNRVEAYLSLESRKRIVGNVGTYESAVLGVANARKLVELRRSRPRLRRPVIPGPPPPKGPTIEHQKEIGLWAVKLPSADAIVVRKTLANLTENPRGIPGVNETPEHVEKREAYWSTVKPAHFGVKISSKSLLGVFRFITVGAFIGIFGKFSFGRWLLLKFPSIFSLGWVRKKGPTEER